MDGAVRFIVTGTSRCGSTLLSTSLNSHPEIYCGGEILLGRRKIARTLMRRRRRGGVSPAWRYLEHKLFSPARMQHFKAIGCKFLFHQILDQGALQDLRRERVKVIRIWRNPVVCAISSAQSHRDRVWHRKVGEKLRGSQRPVRLSPPSLVRRCRFCERCWNLMSRADLNLLDITYRDLSTHFQETMTRCYEFLGVSLIEAKPKLQKLRYGTPQQRCANWRSLSRRVPKQYRHYFHEDVL